ncbi:hypothetical protein HYPSUDRAFT_208732 [Hypholoma sublateritium FD-334 SS-4]|uniref:Uncharacterized protein n=1 Tax=Hypholoma sublateritium (strain FD-334 SS-4) TaxID=945553 RepID=A0A0D2KIC5_HYPSF|nr:hypothetical protein HYPSUDRAFT_208732 [Hypholoma sublateritium FD-334 SS-4]
MVFFRIADIADSNDPLNITKLPAPVRTRPASLLERSGEATRARLRSSCDRCVGLAIVFGLLILVIAQVVDNFGRVCAPAHLQIVLLAAAVTLRVLHALAELLTLQL